MRVPMAMEAEKGPVRAEEEGVGVDGSRRVVAPIRSEAVAEPWIWEAAMSLWRVGRG
jgi:hypothetical protein